MPIIESILDNDLYKFTMQQFVLHQFPGVNVKYKFKCRNKGINLAQYKNIISDEIRQLDRLSLRSDEAFYLNNMSFISKDYVDFLNVFRFDYSRYVEIDSQGKDLIVEIEGPWLHTILYEVPILAIINETYFSNEYPMDFDMNAKGIEKLNDKIDFLRGTGVKFADFCTRRRRSREWHRIVLAQLITEKENYCFDEFVGTSNVNFARKYGIKCVGTMAHEIFQVMQSQCRLEDSQKYALQKWSDEFRGELGIALSDTLGVNKFIRDFDRYFALLFDGLRQDSGDPFEWFDKIYAHYNKLNVNPKNKTVIFSDGLNAEKVKEIHRYVDGRMKCSFGIGTNLGNDLGPTPLQIVIKVVEADGQPVAKISDSPGKMMCEDQEYIDYLKSLIDK